MNLIAASRFNSGFLPPSMVPGLQQTGQTHFNLFLVISSPSTLRIMTPSSWRTSAPKLLLGYLWSPHQTKSMPFLGCTSFLAILWQSECYLRTGAWDPLRMWFSSCSLTLSGSGSHQHQSCLVAWLQGRLLGQPSDSVGLGGTQNLCDKFPRLSSTHSSSTTVQILSTQPVH